MISVISACLIIADCHIDKLYYLFKMVCCSMSQRENKIWVRVGIINIDIYSGGTQWGSWGAIHFSDIVLVYHICFIILVILIITRTNAYKYYNCSTHVTHDLLL